MNLQAFRTLIEGQLLCRLPQKYSNSPYFAHFQQNAEAGKRVNKHLTWVISKGGMNVSQLFG